MHGCMFTRGTLYVACPKLQRHHSRSCNGGGGAGRGVAIRMNSVNVRRRPHIAAAAIAESVEVCSVGASASTIVREPTVAPP